MIFPYWREGDYAVAVSRHHGPDIDGSAMIEQVKVRDERQTVTTGKVTLGLVPRVMFKVHGTSIDCEPSPAELSQAPYVLDL